MAKNIVLVHGGFVDGAGWEGVYKILKRDGYSVSIVQNPTISLEDDVAVTKRTLAAQDGPTILVGHSYGGAVITEAGNHPNVSADRKSTRLNSSHGYISYAVFCLKKKKNNHEVAVTPDIPEDHD